MKRIFTVIISLFLILSLFAGCGDNNAVTEEFVFNNEENAESQTDNSASEVTDKDVFTERDYDAAFDENACVSISLDNSGITSSSDSVKISNSTVTITEEAVYLISGSLSNGMIAVDADDGAKIQIVLNGVDINNDTSAALYIKNADKIFITLKEGTHNFLSNGGSFEAIDENSIDAAIFSKQDITFNGVGELSITSPSGHGIAAKDDLVITGGTYSIKCANHGLDVNDSVRITGETVIEAVVGKDGIHCENSDDSALGYIYISQGSFNIEAEGDGISASSYLKVINGTAEICAGGGSGNASQSQSDYYGGFMGGRGKQQMPQSQTETDSASMKGIKADGDINITGGVINVNSADDAIHSNSSIAIDGGQFIIKSGDDAMHAEEKLTVNSGTVNISESYEGLEAQNICISGGDIIVNATDDGLNASGGNDSSGFAGGRDGMFGGGKMGGGSSNGSIEIMGGVLKIYAAGDGIDSNGSLTISGGIVHIANTASGDTSVLDSDVSPVITGGTFTGVGATTMMAQSFSSSSSQGVIACTTGNQKSGAQIKVATTSGKELISFDAEYNYVLVIISSPDIEKGETYILSVGGQSSKITAN